MAYCRNCGHPLDPSIKHCPKCGSANPEYAKPKKKGAGNLLFFLLGIVLSAGILAGVIAAGWLTIGNTIGKKENKASKVEGAGYNTPEEAVKAYAQYLKAGDLDGLLSTCAIESYASHLRAEIYYEMYSGFMANSSLPPGTDLRNRIDAEQQRESFIKSLRDAYVNYAIRGTEYEEQMNSTHMLMIQEGETGRFIEIMSNEIPFDSMEIGETIL